MVSVAAMMGSFPGCLGAFQLTLRPRGLGSCLTSLHLLYEKEVATLLGIPSNVLQVALLPVAYTKGLEFKRAKRPDPSSIVHWDSWGRV